MDNNKSRVAQNVDWLPGLFFAYDRLLSCLQRFQQYRFQCPFRVRPASIIQRAPALLAGLLIGGILELPVYDCHCCSKPLPNNFSRQSDSIQSFIYQLERGFSRTFVAYKVQYLRHFLGTDAAYSAHPMTAVLIVGDP
ncbi:hypothetical protein VKT23_012136 [Stygiomarasmius scandens]|uniref:Uncharacterized protein n=1 Tax=Marasmiellus scandens TaxID=2682957 RepID=A0ABR1JAD8_9AGAR